MLFAQLHSSASSGSLRCHRFIGHNQNAVTREFGDELLGVSLRLFQIDFKLPAHPVAHNIAQRSVPVGRLENRRRHFVQREKSRIGRVHHHHFARQRARRNRRTARDVNAILRHAAEPPASCESRPTPAHRDKTSTGEPEPCRRNRTPSRTVDPPGRGPPRKTKCCAEGAAPLPPTTVRQPDSTDPAPEKTAPKPQRSSSPPIAPALPQKVCRTPSTRPPADADRKFRRSAA